MEKHVRIVLAALVLLLPCVQAFAQPSSRSNDESLDSEGRQIIRGTVGSGRYNNVHIISDTVGIEGYSVTVTNSVIEAPVCIRTGGYGALVSNNLLLCDLCIQFTGSSLINNTLTNNRCSGQGTNRPDVMGW